MVMLKKIANSSDARERSEKSLQASSALANWNSDSLWLSFSQLSLQQQPSVFSPVISTSPSIWSDSSSNASAFSPVPTIRHTPKRRHPGRKKKTTIESDALRQYAGYRLTDFKGKISALSRDQYGCRFLQKILEDGDKKSQSLIFDEVRDDLPELIVDPFGNYLCQKLFECCSNEQRSQIIRVLAPSMSLIARNVHGTRAIQRLVDYIEKHEQASLIIRAMSRDILPLIKDMNANHVIQKFLTKFTPNQNSCIYETVIDRFIEVSAHKHGCCVVQRCIDFGSEKQRSQMVAIITENALMLVQNAYGNYVVQYVLESPHTYNYANEIIKCFKGRVYELSLQKFSSNVMEKCLRNAGQNLRQRILTELLDATKLQNLLSDPFGNYVVQTAIDVANDQIRAEIMRLIKPHLSQFKDTPTGKRITSRILQYIPCDPLTQSYPAE